MIVDARNVVVTPADGTMRPVDVRPRIDPSNKLQPRGPRARAMTGIKLFVALALIFPTTGCGTKTELLLPDGKPNPAGQKDPSQPPSPISR